MQYFICFLTLFLTTASYPDSMIKLYDIYNLTDIEFIAKPNEPNEQCQRFAKIPPFRKSCKVIEFDNIDKHNCIAMAKHDDTCGLLITLLPRRLLQVEPFGNCHLKSRTHKISQRIDRLLIGLTE